jgi:hypothetical protein
MAERSVYVIATTPDGTAGALLEAQRLAAGTARIVMLVPVPIHAAPLSSHGHRVVFAEVATTPLDSATRAEESRTAMLFGLF